jgi:uncharacterized protein
MQFSKLKKWLLADLSNRLSGKLTYHGLHHTLDVLRATEDLCALENVGQTSTTLLKTAALLHDAGFVEDKHMGHEAASCTMARMILPEYGYSESQIEHICQMIMGTKIPQSPIDRLGEILCDADLDYLGRDDFYPIAHSLYEELKTYGIVKEETVWDEIQVGFLEKHQFFTKTNRARRENEKQKRIQELRQRVSS